MSPRTPGQKRRARRVSQIRQLRFANPYRIIAFMPRTDLFIKVEIEHDADESPQRLAAEICRQVQKVYGVRSAELSNFLTHADEEAPR